MPGVRSPKGHGEGRGCKQKMGVEANENDAGGGRWAAAVHPTAWPFPQAWRERTATEGGIDSHATRSQARDGVTAGRIRGASSCGLGRRYLTTAQIILNFR